MKTPITYYGGKTNMLKHILPLIPEGHRAYVEPFVGGGAVLFGKPQSRIEVINDNLDSCVNFYRVCQTDFGELQSLIRQTLHAESDYHRSKEIIKAAPGDHDPVLRAWAFWVQNRLVFGHKMCGGFAFAKAPLARTTATKVDDFTDEIRTRLRNVQIFNRDALDVIRRFDDPDTFMYLDPPYANADCGHYNKGKDVFYQLLELLPTLQSKWLLSSYPCPELDAIWRRTGVYHQVIDQPLAVSKANAGKRKSECLTWNYRVEEMEAAA